MSSSSCSDMGEKVIDYSLEIQRGRLIQSYGCLLALDTMTSKVIAYSSNASEMLIWDASHPCIIGIHVCDLFIEPSASELQKALDTSKVSLLNPIMVQSKTSNKIFYAFLHLTTNYMIIDFEPAEHVEFPTMASTHIDLRPFSIASKATFKIQSQCGGGIKELCNTVANELLELTGYGRVMVNMFHEDGHCDIVAEAIRPGLDPYLGMHYPATDIPQASRSLFMMNRVQMVFDSHAKLVEIIANGSASRNINLSASLLRAPHSCHLQYMKNMNTSASLTLAVIVKENQGDEVGHEFEEGLSRNIHDNKTLWGLIICHDENPRYAPFPLRCACEFLVQMFGIHVRKELDLEKHRQEKRTMQVVVALSGVLLREASSPCSIINDTPNIMGLVKCDGAAILHGDRVWRLHLSPPEVEIRKIAEWLLDVHKDSPIISTMSLYDIGYPRALVLDHHAVICGMAVAVISSNYIVFWFRSHDTSIPTTTWGGAKHCPSNNDKTKRIGPRSSFCPLLFFDVEKMMKSSPWRDYEMEGIRVLQLVLKTQWQKTKEERPRT